MNGSASRRWRKASRLAGLQRGAGELGLRGQLAEVGHGLLVQEAVDHQDELSVIELHGAMLTAADTYGSAEWDRLWRMAGFGGRSDETVVRLVKSMLSELTHQEAS